MVRSSSPAAPADSRVIAGRYRVEALLGAGGMGAVYCAVDAANGARVAVKCMRGAASPTTLELFKREFHTLHGLRHPSIVEVYDYGDDEGLPFYTMELLQGRDLGNAAPLTFRVVCGYLRQIASVLSLLHARRLLHRDISPRNIWVLPDGRLKLIDFGALCPFGPTSEVVGTPPFVAPEWLQNARHSALVDQRADIYGLGALGYWLLTKTHAFPARSLVELQEVWARKPAPPSSLVRPMTGRALEPIPPELDALLLSMLALDPTARPATTELVIDRIDAFAGPAAEPSDHAVRGFVRSKAFVGRRQERQLFELARKSERCALLFEAEAGLGRSRLLDELCVLGRLSGATCVLVKGTERERAYAVANALALGLLNHAPREAREAAQPHAAVLSRLSPELARRLGVSAAAGERGLGTREQLQRALTAWVCELAGQRKLVLLVDDFEDTDEESSAWLAALARTETAHGLVLVAALERDPVTTPGAHQQLFRSAARAHTLAPLTAAETHELLASVFGQSQYLDRISRKLHDMSAGSPAHCLELVEVLIDQGLVRYTEGAWTLPGHLADSELPRTRSEVHVARCSRLGATARRLGELMSIHDGRLTRAGCEALFEQGPAETAAALVELTLCAVVNESELGYGFTHPSLRDALSAGLHRAERERAHARLGAALLREANDPIDALRAGLHLFRAGDRTRCHQLVQAAVIHLFEGHRRRMHIAMPLLEQAVALYRDAGWGPRQLAAPLAALAIGSFFIDHRLAERYGEQALDALEHVLCFDRARKLRNVVGAKLALVVALASAAARRRASPEATPTLRVALRMLVGCAVGLNAVATSSTDTTLTARCRAALDPLSAFGERHAVGLVRRGTIAVGSILDANHPAALAELRAIAAKIASEQAIRKLPEHVRRELDGGCWFSIGFIQCWRQDPEALAIADRIERLSPMYAMNADQLREAFYAGRGDMLRAAACRQRVEMQALRVGAAWQIVTLAPIQASLACLWMHDAMQAKRAAAELERLSRELPALAREARRSRACYLVLSERYAEAIDSLQPDDARADVTGGSRVQGILARAHNRLGQHAQARQICQEALSTRTEEDLSFVVMYLHVQLELAIAEAALGEAPRARERLELLRTRHEAAGPLMLGAVHEACVRVALIERDLAACREHLEQMRSCYLPTQVPSLAELTRTLATHIEQAQLGPGPDAQKPNAESAPDDKPQVTRMQRPITRSESSFEKRALRCLNIALELTRAQQGFIASSAAGADVVSTGAPPQPELLRWAAAYLARQDDHTLFTSDDALTTHTNELVLGDMTYRVVALYSRSDADMPAHALVLGFRDTTPCMPHPRALAELATRMFATREERLPTGGA